VPTCDTPSPNQQRRKSELPANGPASLASSLSGPDADLVLDDGGFGDFDGFCGMVNELSGWRGE
jgi:hypothetical protein